MESCFWNAAPQLVKSQALSQWPQSLAGGFSAVGMQCRHVWWNLWVSYGWTLNTSREPSHVEFTTSSSQENNSAFRHDYNICPAFIWSPIYK